MSDLNFNFFKTSECVLHDLEQGSDEWLEWRMTGVTATATPVLLKLPGAHCTPWRLYMEHFNMLDKQDLSYVPQVRNGNFLEGAAREWMEEQTGLKFYPVCVSHKKHSFMKASLDGLTYDGKVLLEIKNLSEGNHLKVISEGVNSEAFRYYYFQVQHQLFCTGAAYGLLLFWSGSDEPVFFRIEPNSSAHKLLFAACQNFHACIEKREAPEFDTSDDVLDISGKWPEILNHMVLDPSALYSEVFDHLEELNLIAEEAYDIKANIKKLKDALDKKEEGLKKAVHKLAEFYNIPGDKLLKIKTENLSWTESISEGRVNWKDIAMKLDPQVNSDDYPDCKGKSYETLRWSYKP